MTRLPKAIARDVLPAYELEYKELSANWASLDRKAQLTGASAGALLTGVVAFQDKSDTVIPGLFDIFLAILAITLFVAGIYALRALLVTDETLPMPGEKLRKLALTRRSECRKRWKKRYRRDAYHMRVVFWDEACEDLHRSTGEKGLLVRRAQAWLAVAAGTAMIFVLAFAFVRWNT